jgi:hypothetical protein
MGCFFGGHGLAYPHSTSSAIARSANGRSLSARLCRLRRRFSLGGRAYARQQPGGPGRDHRRAIHRSGICRSGGFGSAGSGGIDPRGVDRHGARNGSGAKSRSTEIRRSGAGRGTEGAGGSSADSSRADRPGRIDGADCPNRIDRGAGSGSPTGGCTPTGSDGGVDVHGGSGGGAHRSTGSGSGDRHHGNAPCCRATEEARPQEGGAEAAAPELLRLLLGSVLGQSLLRQPVLQQSVRPSQRQSIERFSPVLLVRVAEARR